MKFLGKSVSRPKELELSIVTVNLNSGSKLFDTANSLTNLQNFEWIVIDGGSTDIQEATFSTYPKEPDVFISEKDSGIYDAMNKGLAHAKGKKIYFLNSGDLIISVEKFEEALTLTPKTSWSLSPISLRSLSGKVFVRGVNSSSIFFAKFGIRPLPHQGAIFGADFIKGIVEYDLSVGLAADQFFMIECWKMKQPVILSSSLCDFKLDGVGSMQPTGSFARQVWEIKGRGRGVLIRWTFRQLGLVFSLIVHLKTKLNAALSRSETLWKLR
jgi:glycosyltransferase involved in cell wall biosynthesis